MNTVFIQRNLARHVIAYLADSYFKHEQEAIGAQLIVFCNNFEDVFLHIDRTAEPDFNDSFDVMGIVPTAGDLLSLHALTNGALVNVVLGENQITAEIEKDEAVVDNAPAPLIANVWMFYNGNEVPAFIHKLDLALASDDQSEEITAWRAALIKLDTMKAKDAMVLLDEAMQTDWASFTSIV